MFDTKLGGASHDVLRHSVGGAILQRINGAEFDAIFVATPCSSYSVRHDPVLRSAESPEGVDPLPEGWEAYVFKHNALAEFTALVIAGARATGTPLALD